MIINDKEVVFPSSLSEITLEQRISFQQEHGDLLDKMLESILGMEDELQKELELIEFRLEKMCRSFAFFSNCTVEAVKEYKTLDDIARIYYSCLAVLFEEEKNQELQQSFIWKGEEWEIAAAEIKQGHKGKFGEFVDAKQTIKDMMDLGAGKWGAMLRLCAIYLRKKNEEYKEEFLYDGSKRMELMKSLPMNIVNQVGFFLSGSQNFYLNTLTSLEKAGSKEQGRILKPTLTAMAG